MENFSRFLLQFMVILDTLTPLKSNFALVAVSHQQIINLRYVHTIWQLLVYMRAHEVVEPDIIRCWTLVGHGPFKDEEWTPTYDVTWHDKQKCHYIRVCENFRLTEKVQRISKIELGGTIPNNCTMSGRRGSWCSILYCCRSVCPYTFTSQVLLHGFRPRFGEVPVCFGKDDC